MSSKKTDIITGMGIGLAVGTAAAVAGTKMMTKSGRKACRKTADRCMKNIGNMMDSMSAMMMK
ncbi:MAG: hypothetical protein U0L11_09380 [Acutalibacteraceae bacterium]|nr:hypothetical protein [Acutalibacteraceae bacterium]